MNIFNRRLLSYTGGVVWIEGVGGGSVTKSKHPPGGAWGLQNCRSFLKKVVKFVIEIMHIYVNYLIYNHQS